MKKDITKSLYRGRRVTLTVNLKHYEELMKRKDETGTPISIMIYKAMVKQLGLDK